MNRFSKNCLKLFMLALLPLSSCDLEKEIEIDLPQHKSQLVVECYLEPGKPYRLTVYESAGYFDRPEPVLVPDARVIISHNGKADTLQYQPQYDQTIEKLYTHVSKTVAEGKPGDIYSIEIKDSRGRQIKAFTQVQPLVPIDTLEYKFSTVEEEAYLLARFRDDPSRKNRYRLIINKDSLRAEVQNDYLVNDQLENGKEITVRTRYKFKPNDTLYVRLYHVEEKYYEFVKSTSDARDANGNPFAQPASIKSTVEGGMGVFTFLTYDRKQIIIKK